MDLRSRKLAVSEKSCDSMGSQPKWVTIANELECDVKSLDRLISELEVLQCNSVVIRFDSDVNDENKISVNEMSNMINLMFKNCESKIRNIASDDSSDFIVIGKVKSKLANSLTQLYTKFKACDRKYKVEMKYQDDFLYDKRPYDDIDNYGFTDDQLSCVSVTESLISSRERDIDRIVEDVEDLSELFKQLGTLVHDQDSILDRIDYNIEQAGINVEGATSELVKAEKYQKKNKLMLFMYLQGILITGLATGLVIKKTT